MSRAVWLSSVVVIGSLVLASPCHASQEMPPTAQGHALPQAAGGSTAIEDDAGETEPLPLPAPSSELRDALAHVVIECNVVASQRDSLLQQRWLIIGYAVAASLLAVWFLCAGLRRSATGRQTAILMKPTTATVRRDGRERQRTNATITIRNGATQEPEVTERVATRQLFRPRSPAEATTKVMAAPARSAPATAKIPAESAAPTAARPAATRREATEYAPSDVPPKAKTVDAPAKATVVHIGSQRSILLTPQVTDSLDEPPTTEVRIARRAGRMLARQGLSLLEVMISLAILATVMVSVSGGIFALSSAQRTAKEEAAITAMMQMWAERMVGADWEWLGRDHLDDPLRGAWSWQRPELPGPPATGDHPPLREQAAERIHDAKVQLLAEGTSGVADLHCYLEYYHPVAMELCFMPGADTAPGALWEEVRPAYRLPPPIDLRQHLDAVVVRLSATWTSQDGGQRRRDLVFARTR